jgi:pentatricopeptide repeat protein
VRIAFCLHCIQAFSILYSRDTHHRIEHRHATCLQYIERDVPAGCLHGRHHCHNFCQFCSHLHSCASSCRAYKIRDVFEEMDLCGVPPAALTYFRVIFSCMKARRLGDTLYYWHRMQRAGIVPDVSVQSGQNSAQCGSVCSLSRVANIIRNPVRFRACRQRASFLT